MASYIGSATSRVDGFAKVTGTAKYAAERDQPRGRPRDRPHRSEELREPAVVRRLAHRGDLQIKPLGAKRLHVRQFRAPSAERGDETFILLVTARDDTEDLQHALDAGANDYLMKPLDVGLLNVRLSVAERQIRDLTD